jgi:hypothetical protein
MAERLSVISDAQESIAQERWNMKRTSRRFNCRLACVLTGAILCMGCSSEKPSAKDRFIPPAELARTALEAVLVDWQAGHEPRSIDGLAVGVHLVDKQRKKKQTLAEFEILGEAPCEAARCFAVRVKLQNPDVEEKVRFLIVGIDPLWVFRQEDYENLSQWACGNLEEESQPPSAEDVRPESISTEPENPDSATTNGNSVGEADASDSRKAE